MADGNTTIFNEGRVVGLSAYEEFLRRYKAQHPQSATAPTEDEWLLNTVSSGRSLILHVPAVAAADETTYTAIDIALPASCGLAPASTIHADFFYGDCTWDGTDTWGKYVSSYGGLIANRSGKHPSTGTTLPASNIPKESGSLLEPTLVIRKAVESYMKIIDGVIVQSGQWTQTAAGISKPYADFSVDTLGTYQIRLLIKGSIGNNARPCVLLTGFVDKDLLDTVSHKDGSVNKTRWQNGAYLGPERVPWSTKIVFSTPPTYLSDVYHPSAGYATITSHNTFSIFSDGDPEEGVWVPVQGSATTGRCAYIQPTTSGYIWGTVANASGGYATYRVSSGETYRIHTMSAYDSSVPSSVPAIIGQLTSNMDVFSTVFTLGTDQPVGSIEIVTEATNGSNYLIVNTSDNTSLPQVWVKE